MAAGPDDVALSRQIRVDYTDKVLAIARKEMGSTIKGVAKQTLLGAMGAAGGGLVFGPIGALVGGIGGSIVAFIKTDNYDGLIQRMMNMSKDEKWEFAGKVQDLVTSSQLADFVLWLKDEGNMLLLVRLMGSYVDCRN